MPTWGSMGLSGSILGDPTYEKLDIKVDNGYSTFKFHIKGEIFELTKDELINVIKSFKSGTEPYVITQEHVRNLPRKK